MNIIVSIKIVKAAMTKTAMILLSYGKGKSGCWLFYDE